MLYVSGMAMTAWTALSKMRSRLGEIRGLALVVVWLDKHVNKRGRYWCVLLSVASPGSGVGAAARFRALAGGFWFENGWRFSEKDTGLIPSPLILLVLFQIAYCIHYDSVIVHKLLLLREKVCWC